jgi:hypothetical protein
VAPTSPPKENLSKLINVFLLLSSTIPDTPISLKMVIKEDGPDKTATAREHVDQLDGLTAERDGLHIPEVDSTGYRIREEAFGTRRKLRVVLMGAGASTVNFLKKAEETMQNLDVTVYEKNHDIGGTWLENRYPGCACDVRPTRHSRRLYLSFQNR